MRRVGQHSRSLLLGVVVLLSACVFSGASPTATPRQVQSTPADFSSTWARTDRPVAAGEVKRTWIWGPTPFTEELAEVYVDAPTGKRRVVYYDKARMEITDPAGDPTDPWHVTNGLLVVELMTGRLQVGDDTFQSHEPADVNVAGDPDGQTGPTYASLAKLRDDSPVEEGATITASVDRAGDVSDDQRYAEYEVTAGPLAAETGHRTAEPFWRFMNSSGLIWNGTASVEAPLFPNPYYATGYPITEAYWTQVPVGGDVKDVLLQCFERRCLTYTPGNPEGFKVEAGNVGQHYYHWRYEQLDLTDPEPYPERLDALPEATFVNAAGESSTMKLEVVTSEGGRSCGLMHRLEMPENQGMLFVFEQDQQGGFWNCNTFIPLTLAWIAEDGEIVDLTGMMAATPGEPQDPTTYRPQASYRYVIEANRGWFVEHGIEIGDRVDLTEPLAVGPTSGRPICSLLGLECG